MVEMNLAQPDDVFQGPGFTMRRYGRFIQIQTHRTPEQQAQLLEAVWKSRHDILARIRCATDELSALIRKHSSFDLVLNLWLRECLFDANQYKETESTQRPHVVEHATMLQLKENAPQVTQELLVDAQDVLRAEELVAEIFKETTMFYAAEAADPELGGSPPSALDELRRGTLLREMMVGPPAYTHHWMAVLEGLFGPAHIDAYLTEVLGFNFKATVSCYHATAALMGETLVERSWAAQKSQESMKQQLKRYMETGKFDGGPGDKAMFDAVRNMRSKERKHFISSVAAQWVTVALADVLSFTPAMLASRARVTEEIASKFLKSFSLAFGSTPVDYVIPAPVPAVRVRPIVNLSAGNYLCPLPFNLVWAIKPRFEEALKQSSRWNSYQKHRGAFLVEEGLKALKKVLPGSQTHQRLTYPVGPGQEAELDGLVLFDRYAFLLEGKAGEFGAARRGGKDRIKKALKELVGDPSEQGVRAWDYIRKNEKPVFSAQNGNEIEVDKSRCTEISLITLTLDSLDVFTPEVHRLRDTGVLGHHDLPWAVCLTDLIAISEILRFPSEFTHFLRWRLAVNEAGDISAGTDELNWLAIYLKEGPQVLRVPQGFTNMSFTSYTDDLDAYFLYQGGFRSKPAEQPAQPIPPRLRELLTAIESSSRQGFTAPAELLLNLTFQERENFAHKLMEMQTPHPGDMKSMTFQTRELRITTCSGQLSAEELESQFGNPSPRDRTALLLAIDSSAGLRVSNWQILPSNP